MHEESRTHMGQKQFKGKMGAIIICRRHQNQNQIANMMNDVLRESEGYVEAKGGGRE